MIPKYKAYIIKENSIVDVETLHWNKGYGGALEIHVHNPNWSFIDMIDGKPYDPNNPPFFTYINHTDKVWLERQPHEFVLLPYSTLNDIDGDEIYLGDTLSTGGHVVFGSYSTMKDGWGVEEKSPKFCIKWDDGSGYSELDARFAKITGNIHIKK